jgi:hypothetical protein
MCISRLFLNQVDFFHFEGGEGAFVTGQGFAGA